MSIDITKLTIEEIVELKRQLSRVRIGQPGNPAKPGRPARTEYPAFDWSKRNYELALEHGYSSGYIGMLRKKFGAERKTKWWPECKEWDWTKSNTEISRMQGADIVTIRNYRKQLGHPPVHGNDKESPPPLPPKEPGRDWERVDWTRSDVDLCMELGVSRERVRQVRVKLGKPKRYEWQLKFERFKERFKEVKELSYAEANEAEPLAELSFTKYCRRLWIKRKLLKTSGGSKHPWALVDWRLPNRLLDEIWKLPAGRASTRRCDYQSPKPLFRCVAGKFPEEFRPLVEAQEAKASEWFALKANGHVISPAPVQLSPSEQSPVQ